MWIEHHLSVFALLTKYCPSIVCVAPNKSLFRQIEVSDEPLNCLFVQRSSGLIWHNWPLCAQHKLHLDPTSEFLLPVHLIEEVLGSQEEVVDLAALLVSLCGEVDSQLRLGGQELTDVGHGEHNLLHGAVLTHNLNRDTHHHLGICRSTLLS